LGVADDAVLVGRICGAGGRVLGTLVNYACHPTTLAWQNTRISPDYVGAMRQVVEEATSAPCLFVQGASGDLGPRDGFVGEAEVADRNGRCLGYAVLSTLESLPAPGRSYAYAGPVVSGATLGVWEYVELAPPRARQLGVWRAERFVVPLKYRGDLPQADLLLRDREHWRQAEARAQQAGDAVAARDARAMAERATRALSRVQHLPPGDWFPYPVQLWRMGDAVWLALGGEHYNLLQRELRRRFPGVPLLIGTLANGSNVWYVLDQDSYGRGLYQESVSVLAKGSLERLIETLASQVEALFS
jgi:hypothetical protein